jgi:hypothetical protein
VARQAWAQGGGAPTTPQALNRYAYAQNAPLRCTDPTGHWIESAVDIAFIAYDIWDIHQNGLTWDNGLALAADVGGLLLPGLTGVGMAVRGGRAAKAAVEAASLGDEMVDAGQAVAKAAGHADDVADAARAAAQGGEAADAARVDDVVDPLKQRVDEIHRLLDPYAQHHWTTAIVRGERNGQRSGLQNQARVRSVRCAEYDQEPRRNDDGVESDPHAP